MQLICPECKNEVDLDQYSDLEEDDIVECDVCGINLLVTYIDDENGGDIEAEVVEEGK